MPSLPRHRSPVAWLTLVAMALALLAPGISRAVAFAKGDVTPWGVICSVGAGGRMADGEPSQPSAAHALDACALCVLSCDAPPLPAVPIVIGVAAALGRAMPLLFLQAPRRLFAWLAALPRAPPFSS
jgi:hypothetical protein